MTLREMKIEDLDQVMEIENDLISPPWSREGFFTYIIKDQNLFVVVEEKGEILGFAGLLLAMDQADIATIAVKRTRQHEGIGQFMLEGVIRLAQELGICVFYLEVRASNEEAIRLYERCGFGRDGIRKGYYTDPDEDALLMSRSDIG
ncbi:MAG: ribosomal protein S18-alanine N-acetyltransferase [Blautia sp.]|nr:ribosomal protein S18-alanine N-acetyltransferase [Blautia sp.]